MYNIYFQNLTIKLFFVECASNINICSMYNFFLQKFTTILFFSECAFNINISCITYIFRIWWWYFFLSVFKHWYNMYYIYFPNLMIKPFFVKCTLIVNVYFQNLTVIQFFVECVETKPVASIMVFTLVKDARYVYKMQYTTVVTIWFM